MIGKAFIDPETERIYFVCGVVPAHDDLGGSGALIILRDGLEARLMSAFKASELEGDFVFRIEIIMRTGPYRYPAGTPFVLYRVANWKNGKVWATPLREFQQLFEPLDGGIIEALPTEKE